MVSEQGGDKKEEEETRGGICDEEADATDQPTNRPKDIK